jgi:MerR family mercuric resistance operon transcriptional regulator
MMQTRSRARPLPIGRLSETTGVNIETIRYYERVGLLPAPARSADRHRLYNETQVQRVSFIRRSRELGFSLNDVRALLTLADNGDAAYFDTKELTLRHLADVRGKIASLRKLARALTAMTDACQPGSQRSCPILDTLNASI